MLVHADLRLVVVNSGENQCHLLAAFRSYVALAASVRKPKRVVRSSMAEPPARSSFYAM